MEFREGDLVWINLRKERFPRGKFGKLQDRADGPFRVLKRLGDNAYQIELPGDMEVSATFNVADLQPYYAADPEQDLDSMTSHFQPGGTDEGPSEELSRELNSEAPIAIPNTRPKRKIKTPIKFQD